MGHTILKSHRIDDINFVPDGYFGEQHNGNDFVLPVDNQQALDQFRKDFSLSRNFEPGLSIVVPFVDPEITSEHIKYAVIAEYFYPILKNHNRCKESFRISSVFERKIKGKFVGHN